MATISRQCNSLSQIHSSKHNIKKREYRTPVIALTNALREVNPDITVFLCVLSTPRVY